MTASYIQHDLATLAAQLELSVPERTSPGARVAARSKQRLRPAVRQAATEALASFRASPEYAALIADLPAMNLFQLQFRLRAALEGPHFAPMLEAMRKPDSLAVDWDDFIPKAVSLGVLAQATLILGVSGSVGYVVDLDLTSPNSGIYAGGAVDAGIDAGIEGDVCLGFWREAVDDLGGIYVGEEVDIDEGLGVTEASFLNDEELGLVFVGFDLGIADGMENTDYYFFEFDSGYPTIYQPGDATHLVQLWGLNCTNSKDDWDTIHFEFLQDNDSTVYRYPAWDGFAMCQPGRDADLSVWSVGLIIKFNSSFTLRLHVGDQTMRDVTLSASNFRGPNTSFTITWNDTVASNQISYTLETVLLK